ncbi:hypothetical protein JCM6882_000806 [Rhodosporidiobolus microsporus]
MSASGEQSTIGSTTAGGNKRTARDVPGGSKGSGEKRTRQRQALSCQECRRLKLKCDRVWPCSACRKRGCADICPVGTAKPPGRAVRIAAEFGALLRRVEDLEAIVRELGAGDRIPPPLHLEEATKRSTTITKELEAQIEDGPAEADPEDEGHGEVGDAEAEKPESDALQKVLVGVGSLSIAESGQTRYLGPAAGSAYYAQEDDQGESSAESVVDEGLATDDIVRYPFIQLGNHYPKASEIERLRGFLPAPEEAKRLADNYWNYLSFQFTPVGAQLFWDDYLPSAYTPHSPHGTKLACVFIILSLGTLFDPDVPSTPNSTAHHYFILSQTVLSASRFLANSTLAAIQTLQLSANFLLNNHDLREGGESFFPVLGMAMRMLVATGAHRDGESFGLSGDELNRRRRVFFELLTLERMQAFISGRPYSLSNAHCDTKMPDGASPYDVAKWRLGLFIGKVIDKAFSIEAPSYAAILSLDQDLRNLAKETPDEVHSGALPARAFVDKPSGIPQLPPSPSQKDTDKDLIYRMRQHTADQMFSQVLFYLHKPAFAQALVNNPDEPLKSPWAASVAAISLETAVYLLAVAKSWIKLHPVLCPRWWHIFFHAFAASVAQSSLVIKSPRSMLAPHAWSQLNEAVATFEAAGAGGAPVAAFVPRLHILRDKAFLALQNVISVPLGLGTARSDVDVSDSLAAGTDASLFILGPPTRLERRQRKKGPGASLASDGSSFDGSSPQSVSDTHSPSAALAEMLGATGALSAKAPPVSTTFLAGPSEAQPYTPFDEPIFRNNSISSRLAASEAGPSSQFDATAAMTPEATLTPAPPSLAPDAAALLYYQHAFAAAGSAYPPMPSFPADRRPSASHLPFAQPTASTSGSATPVTVTDQTYAPNPQALAAYAAALAAQGGSIALPQPPSHPQNRPPVAAPPNSTFFPSNPSASSFPSAYKPPPAFTAALYSGPPPSTSPASAFSPPNVTSPSAPLASSAFAAAAAPTPPQFPFGGFATAFPMAAGPQPEGDNSAEGQGEVGGNGEGWAWFNSLGAQGGAAGGGLSPLDWSKFGEM